VALSYVRLSYCEEQSPWKKGCRSRNERTRGPLNSSSTCFPNASHSKFFFKLGSSRTWTQHGWATTYKTLNETREDSSGKVSSSIPMNLFKFVGFATSLTNLRQAWADASLMHKFIPLVIWSTNLCCVNSSVGVWDRLHLQDYCSHCLQV
jgi:hypothetical protein